MVAYPTFLMPLACWLLMGYYRSIPEELEEAAHDRRLQPLPGLHPDRAAR